MTCRGCGCWPSGRCRGVSYPWTDGSLAYVCVPCTLFQDSAGRNRFQTRLAYLSVLACCSHASLRPSARCSLSSGVLRRLAEVGGRARRRQLIFACRSLELPPHSRDCGVWGTASRSEIRRTPLLRSVHSSTADQARCSAKSASVAHHPSCSRHCSQAHLHPSASLVPAASCRSSTKL